MDETAVGDAYRLYAAAVWRRCVTILRDDARALDVTQEVFMKCLRHHGQLRCGPELMGWLYRVATNLCLNDLRDQKTRGARAAAEGGAEPRCEPDAVARLMAAEVFQGLDRHSQEVARSRATGAHLLARRRRCLHRARRDPRGRGRGPPAGEARCAPRAAAGPVSRDAADAGAPRRHRGEPRVGRRSDTAAGEVGYLQLPPQSLPRAIAFDTAGHLWVEALGIVRIDFGQ